MENASLRDSPYFSNSSGAHVVSIRVDATSYHDGSRRILEWARLRESRYVCVATVNNVMEAYDHPDFREIMNEADLVTADGMPLVWRLRSLGHPRATRVYGPDLTRHLLYDAERARVPIAFYGGSKIALEGLRNFVASAHPRARVVYACSPPFRPLTAEEDDRFTNEIVASGAALLFVGLSTPKQERWMAAHRGRVPCAMIGVGAAFDFLSGQKPQAPRWMMQSGLEWLFRLLTEPRRLWRRYLTQNPRFLALLAREVLFGQARPRDFSKRIVASDLRPGISSSGLRPASGSPERLPGAIAPSYQKATHLQIRRGRRQV